MPSQPGTAMRWGWGSRSQNTESWIGFFKPFNGGRDVERRLSVRDSEARLYGTVGMRLAPRFGGPRSTGNSFSTPFDFSIGRNRTPSCRPRLRGYFLGRSIRWKPRGRRDPNDWLPVPTSLQNSTGVSPSSLRNVLPTHSSRLLRLREPLLEPRVPQRRFAEGGVG